MVQMKELGVTALVFVIVAFIISLGGTMLQELNDNAAGDVAGSACGVAGSASYNATCNALTGIGTYSDFLPLVAIVAVLAVIIGILLFYLAPIIGL